MVKEDNPTFMYGSYVACSEGTTDRNRCLIGIDLYDILGAGTNLINVTLIGKALNPAGTSGFTIYFQNENWTETGGTGSSGNASWNFNNNTAKTSWYGGLRTLGELLRTNNTIAFTNEQAISFEFDKDIMQSHCIDDSAHTCSVEFVTNAVSDSDYFGIDSEDSVTADDRPKWYIEYTQNLAPTVPQLNAPENNSIMPVDLFTHNLNWSNSTDAEGDAITYFLQIWNETAMSNLLYANNSITETTNTTGDLVTFPNETKSYYWRVLAMDSLANSSWSELWNISINITFQPNRAPFNIQIVPPSPANNSIMTNSTHTYNCTAEDLDNDILHYENYLDTSNPPTTLIANETGSSTNITTDGLNWWRCRAVDGKGGASPYSNTRFLRVDNSTIKNITYNRPTSVYETSSNTYEANVTINKLTSSSVTASFTYNSIGYTPTPIVIVNNSDIAVYGFKQTLYTPIAPSTDIIWNFTVNLVNGSTFKDSSTISQTINQILFGLCNTTLTTAYVNYSFNSEKDSSVINASIPSSTFIYSLDSNKALNKTLIFINTTEHFSYAFCFTPTDKNVYVDIDIDYESTGYPQRNYINTTGLYSNITTNHTLLLLKTVDGIYTTFQVINYAGQTIEGVSVSVERLISGVYNWIESAETDSSGAVTFFLNPNYLYRFTFVKSGYDTQTLNINPTQSLYTVTLGQEIDTKESYDVGIEYDIGPPGSTLNNETDYTFTFNTSSSYWSLVESGFVLTNGSGTYLGEDSCTAATGCISSATINTGNNTYIVMNYYWVIDDDGYNYQNATRTWYVLKSGTRKSTVTMFREDIEKLGGGFSDFTKAIISFFIILFVIGIMSYYSGVYSPLALLGEVFFLVLLLDLVGFIPTPINAVKHFVLYIIGILTFSYLIYEYTGGKV